MERLHVLAPYPDSESSIILPTFAMNDTERMDSGVVTQKPFSGGIRTHVKRNLEGRILGWNFTLTRMKALELKGFYLQFAGKKWKFTNLVTGQKWIGYVKINPLTLSMVGTGKIADSNDTVTLTVEFETTEL